MKPFPSAHTSRVLVLAFTVVMLVFTNELHAQESEQGALDSDESPDVDEARARFERAVQLYREGNLDAALAEFRTSYRLNPLPQVLFNVAVTERDLHRYPDAVETLRRYLDEAESEPSRRRETAEELLSELEQLLATIDIRCSEDAADVFVDGELTDRTPIDSPLRVSTGRHELEVRLDGYRTWRESMEVHGGQELTLEVELSPMSRPWYRRWWVWTIVGVVAVGATSGIVAGAMSRPSGADFDVVVEREGAP